MSTETLALPDALGFLIAFLYVKSLLVFIRPTRHRKPVLVLLVTHIPPFTD